jgi:hypothetical protein
MTELERANSELHAEDVAEIFFLRDQNKALTRSVAELKAENRKLRKQLVRRASG